MYFTKKLIAAFAAAAIGVTVSACGSTDDSSLELNPNHAGFTRADGTSANSEKASEAVSTATAVTAAEQTQTQTQETVSAPAENVTTAAVTTTAEVTSDVTEKESEGPSEEKYEIDAYGQRLYKFSDADEAFLSDVTFVGDSICYGLEVYDYMPPDNVLAVGSVAARNIFDFTFEVGNAEYGIVDAVKKVQPKIVVFSMGMNDINLTTPEQYCENYMDLLDKVHAAVPSAKLYVASITPISNNIDFNNNTNIDSFNSAIKQYLADSGKGYGYVDIASYLKDQWNGLSYIYSGGDGIHLQGHAYSAILYQVCEQLR